MLPKGSISRVTEYYYTALEFRGEVLRALRWFFDRPDLDTGGSLKTTGQGEAFFNEWFLFDFLLGTGRTVLEDFVASNPLKLNGTELELYRNLLDNTYGIFETLDVERGQGLTLKDLRTRKQWAVREFSATFNLEQGDVFFSRIGKVGDHYELVGADSFSFQGVDEVTKKSLRREKPKLTPKVVHDFLRGRGIL